MTDKSLNDFLEEFLSQIGPSWSKIKRRVGEFLIEASEALNDGQVQYLKSWLADQYQISISLQNVCMRVARGEMSQEVADRLPPSKAQHMDTPNVPDMDRDYTIIGDDGGPTTKKFRDFTKSEIRANVTSHGVKSIEEAGSKIDARPIVTARADKFWIEDGRLYLHFPSLGKNGWIKISQNLVDQISGAVVAESFS